MRNGTQAQVGRIMTKLEVVSYEEFMIRHSKHCMGSCLPDCDKKTVGHCELCNAKITLEEINNILTYVYWIPVYMK